MKKLIVFLSVTTIIFSSCKNENKDLSINTKSDSLSYAIGASIGNNILNDFEAQGLDTVVNMNILMSAFKAAVDTGEGVDLFMSSEDADAFLQSYFMGLQAQKQEEMKSKYKGNIQKGEAFLAENGKRAGVQTTASGIQYEVLKKGSGAKPTAASVVKTHYHGTLLDGTVFDSSVERGEPVEFPLNRVIPGWTEVLQLMPVGSKWKVWIPQNLAYGESSGPGGNLEPYSTLAFEIELLGISK